MATKKAKKVPVTRAALMARINRVLAKKGLKLKAAKGAAQRDALGDFYVAGKGGAVNDYNIEPAYLARELGVLQAWEDASGLDQKGGPR